MDDTVSVFLVLGMFFLFVLLIVRTTFRVRVMCFVLPFTSFDDNDLELCPQSPHINMDVQF